MPRPTAQHRRASLPGDADGPRQSVRPPRRWVEGLTGWLFLAPGLGVISLCVLIPMAAAFVLSFTHCSRFLSIRWAGVHNYDRLVHDPMALRAFGNTVFYLALFVPLNLALALAVALLLNRNFPLVRLVRSVYFLPVAVSGIVAVSIFRFLLDRDHGPINALLGTLGFEPIGWLRDPAWAMPALILLSLWKSTAFFGIILLAALQDVPRELYEAAAVDGAGPVRRFIHVTLPGIAAVALVVVMLSSIGAFRVFEPMFVLTQGGPRDSTRTISLLAYDAAFRNGELGYANAVTFALLAVILGLTLLLNHVFRRFE